MSQKPVAVVSGANRGLGLETCRQLAELGYSVVLTARDEIAGQRAARQLQESGLDVRFHGLDVIDEHSVDTLADVLSSEMAGLDALVNNAGINPDGAWGQSIFDADADAVTRGFDINTLGAWRLTRRLVPLMGGRGCVVNVSSGMGQLSEMNGCCLGYRLSKTALNALTRAFADELKDTGVKINSVCPGWVRTDMGGPDATLSLADGAKGIVWAATLDDSGPSGGFFRHGQPIPW